MPIWEETPGQTEDTLDRDYISRLAWGHLGVPPEELMDMARGRSVWIYLLKQLPTTRTQIYSKK